MINTKMLIILKSEKTCNINIFEIYKIKLNINNNQILY